MNIKIGQVVNVHYIGTLKDGTEFDNSRKRDTPLSFTLGGGQLLPAFENAVQSMKIGETKSISLTASEAYGEVMNEAIQTVPKTSFTPDMEFEVGGLVSGRSPDGNTMHGKITSIDEEAVILDFNHPLAGKDLTFDIELLSVE